MSATDPWVQMGDRVVRALLCGVEPGPGMCEMAADRLRGSQHARKEALESLHEVRNVLHKTAWLGSQAFDRYEAVCEVIEDLEYMLERAP